jgi:hypothetical protein
MTMPLRCLGPSINPNVFDFDAPFAVRRAAGRVFGKRQDRRSKAELLRRAGDAGIDGRWTMSKRELAAALRDH